MTVGSRQGYLRIEDFGGKGDGVTDNLAAWNAMIHAVSATLSGQNGPGGPICRFDNIHGGVYHFSDMISLDLACTIEGQGAGYGTSRTILDFPLGKRGMSCKMTALIDGSQGAVLRNFILQSSNNALHRQNLTHYNIGDVIRPPVSPYGDYTGWSDTGYLYVCAVAGTTAAAPPAGFATTCNLISTYTETDLAPFTDGGVTWTPVQCHGMNVGANLMTFENILVQNFAGDGWHCYGNTTDTSADNNRFIRCHALQNGGNGWFMKGDDSSANYTELFNSIGNGGWGMFDYGFLGNTHVAAHVRSNGLGGGNGGVWIPSNAGWAVGVRAGPTQQNGFMYGVTAITTGITGATEPVWPVIVGDSVVNGGVTYTCLRAYDGGAYYNRTSVLVGCYSEGDQQPTVNGFADQSAILGGFHGAGFQTDQGLNATGLITFGRYTNSLGSKSKIVDPGQGYGISSYFGPDGTTPNAFGWERFLLSDSSLVTGSGIRIQYNHSDGYWYFINSSNSPGSRSMGIPTDAATDTQTGPMLFPNGIKIDSTKLLADAFLGHNASSYNKGDIILNENTFLIEGSYAASRCVATGAISSLGNVAPAFLSPNFYGKVIDTLAPVKETDLHVVYDDELVTGSANQINFFDRISSYTVNAHGAAVYNNAQFAGSPGVRTSYGRNRQITYGQGSYFSLTAAAAHTIQSTDQMTLEAVLIGVAGLEIATIIGYATVPGTCGYKLFVQADGSVRFQIYNTTPANYIDLVSPAAVIVASGGKHCYHIAVTIDMVNSVFALYVNGILRASATSVTGAYAAANADIGLGAFLQNAVASASGSNTAQAEIMRTKRLLSQAEIIARSAQVCVANGSVTPATPGVESLLSTTVVDLSVGTKQTLYTVPAGRTLVITKRSYRAATAAWAAGSVSEGFDAGASNCLADATHVGLSDATKVQVLSNAVTSVLGNAADVYGIKANTTQAATSFTVDLFGYLI